MHYRLMPSDGHMDLKKFLESITDTPASKELAFCRIREILVGFKDGGWTVRMEGPAEHMEEAVLCVGRALAERAADIRAEISYLPYEKDMWIKKAWSSLAARVSCTSGVNLGALLSCEPSWDGPVGLTVPSEAQLMSFEKREVPEAISDIVNAKTGVSVEVKLSCAAVRSTDYSDSLPEEPEQEEQSSSTDEDVSGIHVYGSPIKIASVDISGIVDQSDYVAVEGEAMNQAVFSSKWDKAVLSFIVADPTGAIYCSISADSEDDLPTVEGRVKVAGSVVMDDRKGTQDAEPLMLVEDVEACENRAPDVLRPCQRVELHCHTKMSALDSVSDPEDVVMAAKQMGQTAVAITDHGVIYSFPRFYQAASRMGIKPVFGMEGYLKDEISEDTSHFTVLVKDKEGLANLYRMVSKSHLEYFKRHPLVPRSLALELRRGLLYGSACAGGELFRLALRGADEAELIEAMRFYDYVEVMPAENSSYLVREGTLPDLDAIRSLNKKLVEAAKKAGKPFVATGDVHYLRKEDSTLRKVLLAGQDYKDFDEQPLLHMRTTEEMLREFAYLGKQDALRAVVLGPNMMVDGIESLKPVPDGLSTPIIEGAEEDVRDISRSEAERLYGSPLPEAVGKRLDKELSSIIGNGFASIYLVAMKLVKKSLSDGYLVGSRGSVGSSLVATLLGITEVNPLPPHYRCGHCKTSDFGPFAQKHGFDLPDRECPSCGKMMGKEGHDIPFEVFLGFEGDKVPDIDLNFSGEYQPRIHKYTEEMFGADNVFRAGTIGTIAEKTAYGFVRALEERSGAKVGRAQSARLAIGATGVRRTTGQHPGGIIVLPEGRDIHEFTPVQHPANSKEKGIITTHFEYTALHDNLLKLDLLGHDDPTMIRMLEEITGESFRQVPFDDAATMSIFSGIDALGIDARKYGQEVGTIGIPEFGTRFVRGMLSETRPSTFDELVRISGLSHGTNVWLDNARDVIRSGDGGLKDVISVRDDIMNFLISKGMPPKSAFQIMERVRKGKGLSQADEAAMSGLALPDWYVDSCNKIKYMFPKAHACAYVMMAFRIAYAKVHMPVAFYSAYLTIRALDFDPSFASMSVREMDKAIRAVDSNKAATQKEKDVVPVLEVLRESLLRGIRIKQVDIASSHPTRFTSEVDGIRAPLSSVPRLGEKASLKIGEARSKSPFSSIDELKRRAGLTKAHISALRDAGALSGLKESEHLELF